MDNEKEFYRLWREYLKRSSDYKELCEFVRAKRKDPALPLPDKFRRKQPAVSPIVRTFLFFYDIHRFTFEQWWEFYQENKARPAGWPGTVAVVDQDRFDWLKKSKSLAPTVLYLEIDLKAGLPPDVIGKLVAKKYTKERRARLGPQHKRLDTLKRYLENYDLRAQGLTGSEILDQSEWTTDIREVWRDIENAGKIIRNAELFDFPGDY